MVASPPPSKPGLAGATARTAPAPIKAAKAWLEDHDPARDIPLLDVSQAAPSDPPPKNMRRSPAAPSLAFQALQNFALESFGAVKFLSAGRPTKVEDG